MYRLRVLGGFALEGPSESSTFPIPQCQAEAVLAVLAVSGDLGCSRERLMALIWPEMDEVRSRRALRSTLHTIRNALGRDAVLSAGELLRLDSRVVTSDVQSFERGLHSDRQEEAVRSYGGPLLDGFHLVGAPDFERWLGAERTRLARECLEALERQAQRAEAAGAWAEAAGWWARAVEQDPLNSPFVLRHARALEALGDRANAIKAVELHAHRLREELELEPDHAVLERIEEMRRGESAALPAAALHPPAEHQRGGEPSQLRLAAADGTSPLPALPPASAPPRPRRLAALGAAVVLVAIGVLAGLLAKRTTSATSLDATAIAVLPFHVVGADSTARTLARSMGELFELEVTGEFGRHISYPGSVAQRWREAGGTLDSGISEASELAVARAVGAGRLVRGAVVATGDSLSVSASMVDVATAAIRVRTVREQGPVAQRFELVTRLIILLLARDAGVLPAETPRLTRYKAAAVQAYLTGLQATEFSKAQNALFHAALAEDSSLVDAAVMLYAVGEVDTAALRYAWGRQEGLTERSRAYLQVLAAGRYGRIRTMAGEITGYEALARRWPEWRTPWGELGNKLTVYGALASIPDWRQRAREAFEQMDQHAAWVQWHLVELAFMDGDTARARTVLDSFAARAGSTGFGATGRLPALRWRLAVWRGDTADAVRQLSHVVDTGRVLEFALADGRGAGPLLDRFAARSDPYAAIWAWARGHERAWRDALPRYGPHPGPLGQADIPVYYQATVPLYFALLSGPPEESLALQATRSLERIGNEAPSPGATPDDQAMARCWITLWRLRHGDTTGARTTQRFLEADPDRRSRFAGWARLIDVLVAEAEGRDVRAALLRMDSVLRDLPLPTGFHQWDPWPAEVQNLLLARLLRRYGEPELALAAVRRRTQGAWVGFLVALPEYLREEGRLAAELGDTTGAIRAYRHYLALRENPDPPWRAAWDSVRAELAALGRRD